VGNTAADYARLGLKPGDIAPQYGRAKVFQSNKAPFGLDGSGHYSDEDRMKFREASIARQRAAIARRTEKRVEQAYKMAESDDPKKRASGRGILAALGHNVPEPKAGAPVMDPSRFHDMAMQQAQRAAMQGAPYEAQKHIYDTVTRSLMGQNELAFRSRDSQLTRENDLEIAKSRQKDPFGGLGEEAAKAIAAWNQIPDTPENAALRAELQDRMLKALGIQPRVPAPPMPIAQAPPPANAGSSWNGQDVLGGYGGM